ncbi:hypothetical protein WR25_23949 [Diploscapter pachys]|uniref:F-box domain-containing protein n=1 Tax=Diploscapter pachys TaxID=2018661 RepID=A0A2A2JL73_9BILA|nr:hypothetical protein WR25_23949 [Diploscapter pachys]
MATHRPGEDNAEADWESRNVLRENAESALNSKIAERLFSRLGRPDIDLFASRCGEDRQLKSELVGPLRLRISAVELHSKDAEKGRDRGSRANSSNPSLVESTLDSFGAKTLQRATPTSPEHSGSDHHAGRETSRPDVLLSTAVYRKKRKQYLKGEETSCIRETQRRSEREESKEIAGSGVLCPLTKMLANLPVEIILLICEYPESKELKQLARTNKRMMQIIKKYLPKALEKKTLFYRPNPPEWREFAPAAYLKDKLYYLGGRAPRTYQDTNRVDTMNGNGLKLERFQKDDVFSELHR